MRIFYRPSQKSSLRVVLHSIVIACIAATATAALAAPDISPSRFVDAERKHKLMQALPQIETLMSERMMELGIPGLAYSIVIDDEVVLAKGLGLRDIATGAPVDGDTVFRIASLTKSFTALAILKLRDAGKLSLDDPVARYVPEMGSWQPPTRDSGPITIRQLLSHTAGLPEDNPHSDRLLDITPEGFSAWLGSGTPYASPTGSAFEYSNLGFNILGNVIMRVSGRPFQAYITEEILLPLGMRSTYWSPSAAPKAQLASGYRKVKDSWIAEPLLEDGAGAASSGLMSSSRDMARYVGMMLAAFPARDESERAPALRRTLREMQAGAGYPLLLVNRPLPDAQFTAVAGSYGYGLFSLNDCTWGRMVVHNGGLPGFGSVMRWLPDHGVGMVVLGNLTYADTAALTRAAMNLLQNTGALKPRQAKPSPTLIHMAQATTDLILDWNDDRARAIAAGNLFLDKSLDERKAEITRLRFGLGACKPGKINATNALRGKFRIDCEQGWLDVTLTLAPVLPPRVQFLEVSAGRLPSPILVQMAETLTRGIASGTQDLRVDPKLNLRDLSAAFESTRLSYGSCSLGDVIASDGATNARFALACNRGPLELSLSLEDGRLADARLSQPGDASCRP